MPREARTLSYRPLARLPRALMDEGVSADSCSGHLLRITGFLSGLEPSGDLG